MARLCHEKVTNHGNGMYLEKPMWIQPFLQALHVIFCEKMERKQWIDLLKRETKLGGSDRVCSGIPTCKETRGFCLASH